MLQAFHSNIKPASAQRMCHLAPVHANMRDQHQSRAITTRHASEAHVAPAFIGPRHPIAYITQAAAQPPNGSRQSFRRMDRDDSKGCSCCFCGPVANTRSPATDQRRATPSTCNGSTSARPTAAAVSLTAGYRAEFKTSRQIVLTGGTKGHDDFFLSGIRHRHLPLRGHRRRPRSSLSIFVRCLSSSRLRCATPVHRSHSRRN